MKRLLRETIQINRLPWKNGFFVIILGLIGAVNLNSCLNMAMKLSYSNSIFSFFVCAFWIVGLYKITQGDTWKRVGADRVNGCFAVACLFFYALICGVSLDQIGKVIFSDWKIYLRTAGLALASTPYVAWCVHKLENLHWKDEGKAVRISERRYFIGTFAILFLAYMLTLLAVWPGFFSYDAEATVHMVFTKQYSAICPKIHVLLLGGVLR